MNKRKVAAAGAALAAVIAGGALTGAALPAQAETEQIEAATVAEQPGSTISRADTRADAGDFAVVEQVSPGS